MKQNTAAQNLIRINPDYSPHLSGLSKNMDSILDLFYKFLIGPDVNRDAESCIQEIGDLRRICIAIKTKSFKDLFEKKQVKR